MTEVTHCLSCKKEISADRIFENSVACECGWMGDRYAKIKRAKLVSQMITAHIALAGLLVALGLIHVAKWGTYSFEVITLLSAEKSHESSLSQAERLLEICKERGHISCQESVLNRLDNDFHKLYAKAELGALYVFLGRDEEAVEALEDFVESGSKDVKALLNLAVAYGHLGEVEKSTEQFRKIFALKPGIVQVTVTRAFVAMLLRNRKFTEAKIAIREIRNNRGTEHIMAKELALVESEILAAN